MTQLINKSKNKFAGYKYFSELIVMMLITLGIALRGIMMLNFKEMKRGFLMFIAFYIEMFDRVFYTNRNKIKQIKGSPRPISDLLIEKQYKRFWINVVLDMFVILFELILVFYYVQFCILTTLFVIGIANQAWSSSKYSDNKENIFALYRMKELKNKSKSIIEQKQSNKSYNKFDFHTSLTTEFYLILNSLTNGQFNSAWKHVKLYIKKMFYIIPSARYVDELSVLHENDAPEMIIYAHITFGILTAIGIYSIINNALATYYIAILFVIIRSYIPSHYLKMLYSK